MIPFNDLLNKLGYDVSPNYHRTNSSSEPETAHLFRSARDAGVDGIYVFETSSGPHKDFFKPRPVVYVAEAENEKKARLIHRKMWNLSFAPFLVIKLPHQVRIYSGFDYSEQEEQKGLLSRTEKLEQLNEILAGLTAEAIDTGLTWKSEYSKSIDPGNRVDRCLLKNLERLGHALGDNNGLSYETAHSLIGKYVYLRYLYDRKILTDVWIKEHGIDPESIFSIKATISSLKKLVDTLEERFNGRIFPIDFENEKTLKDVHIKWVAAVFGGAEISNSENTSDIIIQLHLEFKAYDFEYIPVETLSAIYEQFIFERKAKGAVYTPEILADYLISEMESVKRLERGMKVLDPACGSGVFLVLVYRRIIEREKARLDRKLKAEELLDILQESIFGVERERDACYVAEFSLILTLLHYLEPRDLQNLNFRFPGLHNSRIFECDFFDIEGDDCDVKFREKGLEFDWIVGNPPWIGLGPGKRKDNKFAYSWMENPGNKRERPIGGRQAAEAFSWLVTDLSCDNGITGLLLPATSLFNLKSKNYRQAFFNKHEVLRITNFANLRDVIFGKRSLLPAASIIYRKAEPGQEKQDIVHYAPFSVNQIPGVRGKPWVITINENEIKTLSPVEAEKGETLSWKLALWGTYLDKRTLERIRFMFPNTLAGLCKIKGWKFFQGSELRKGQAGTKKSLIYKPDLVGKKRFLPTPMKNSLFQFSVPKNVLETIPDEMSYIRKRGGEAGLALTYAPHIIISSGWRSYIIYSNEDFVIPSKHMGIAAHSKDYENALYLQALSLYLSSSIAAYHLFFHAPEWGVFRQANKVSGTPVGEIPTPEFTQEQVEKLANLHKELVETEKREISGLISALHQNRLIEDASYALGVRGKFDLPEYLTRGERNTVADFKNRLHETMRAKIDDTVSEVFEVPEDIRLIVIDFFQTRLPLDTSLRDSLVRKPEPVELEKYARELRDELDDFVMGKSYHRVTITYSAELIECVIEITGENAPIPIDENNIIKGDLTISGLLAKLDVNLRERFSQWVYIQRGLRFFQGPKIYLYKKPRLIDWTGTQAKIDAGEIIGEVITET